MIRVFPRRTKWIPDDELAFVGDPPLFRPSDQPVKVSCTFTWDRREAERLFRGWSQYYSNVELGGPAFGNPGEEFEPGRFVKKGITITSRGCPKKCPWCFVPEREGTLREIEIKNGWNIVDNNLLACSKKHIIKVFEMFENQSERIRFSGGLDSQLLRDWHLKLIDKIRLDYIWFACDSPRAENDLRRIAPMVSHIPLKRRRCYVLIGYNGETIKQAEQRLKMVYKIGFLPYAMLYRGLKPIRRCEEWSRDWIELQAYWSQVRLYKKTNGRT